jgi:simple sugar transport system permease protein
MTQSAAGSRVRDVGALRRWLIRPEAAAVAGSILVFVFFAIAAGDSGFLTSGGTASYLAVAAQLGIVAVPVSLLMISGEFDLSVGSMVGAAGMIMAVTVVEYGLPLIVGIVLAFAVALAVGLFNGYVVVRTGLPSFIVTLGMLFALRGLTIGFARLLTGRTQIGMGSEVSESPLTPLFAGTLGEFSVSIIWWDRAGPCSGPGSCRGPYSGTGSSGAGGNADAARNVGVPVSAGEDHALRLHVALRGAARHHTGLDAGSADVLRGELWSCRPSPPRLSGGCS